MTRNKKNKYRPQSKSNNEPQGPVGPTEEILVEVIEVKQMLVKAKQRIRESKSDFAYLLSNKWLGTWKSYTGYEALSKDGNPEDTKGFGKRKPTNKINDDLLAKPDKFLKVPQGLLEFSYLNVVIDDDYQSDKEYIIVDESCWLYLQQRYPDAITIRRPMRKRKSGQPFVDVNLHAFNVVFVSPQSVSKCTQLTEGEFQKAMKRSAKNDTLENIFPIRKIRVPSIWDLHHFREFMQRFIPLHDTSAKEVGYLQFWKMQNYLSFIEARQNLCSFFRGETQGILGNDLKKQQETQKDVDDFLKTSSVLLISYANVEYSKEPTPDKIDGYCEQCIEQRKLTQRCLCGQAFYCSNKCKYDDKAYHFKSCQIAFDSDDDSDYQQKSMYVDTSDVKCGLVNLGNTCYMNSALQCLTNLNFLFEYFSSNKYLNLISETQVEENKGVFVHKFSKFIKKLNELEMHSPYSLKAQISYFISPLKGYSQQDSNDFIVYLLTTLNEFSKKSQETDTYADFISQNLLGKFKSCVTCPECAIQSTTLDLFTQISLPIKTKIADKEIQFVKIDRWNQFDAGSSLIKPTWKQFCLSVGQDPECRKWVGTQGGDIKEITEESLDQIYKKHRKESVLFYNYLKQTPQSTEVIFNLVCSKSIAGNEMKSRYGYPIIIPVGNQMTLSQIYTTVAQMLDADTTVTDDLSDLKASVLKDIKELKEAKEQERKNNAKQEASKPSTQTDSGNVAQPQVQDNQGSLRLDIIKIQEKAAESIVQLRPKLKFRLAVVTGRKGKKLCPYCNKKCNVCILPFSTETTVQQYQKLSGHTLQIDILQDTKTQLVEVQQKGSGHSQYTTLEECLQEFSLPEQLDEYNPWYCQVCDQMRLAWKELKIAQYPRVLILQLKRFKQHNGKKVKNNETVWYPECLQIKAQGIRYQLSGVVIHEGSLDAGHYWAVCRKGQEYFVFNDEEVTKTGEYFHKSAYMLMYEMVQ